jgi:hypothetical protein
MQIYRLMKAVPAAFVIAAFPRFAAALPPTIPTAAAPGLGASLAAQPLTLPAQG